MKSFEQQRSYNPVQYGVGGAPLQAPDIASQIENEYEKESDEIVHSLNLLTVIKNNNWQT